MTFEENKLRSTAKAWPAGTEQDFAISINNESSISSSWISKPEDRSEDNDPKELEHTISPSLSVRWASVECFGLISKSETEIPLSAACHAASQPDKPPPITCI